MGSKRSPLVLIPGSNSNVNAPPDETTDGAGGILRLAASCPVGPRRHPEPQSVNATTGVLVTHVRQCAVTGNLVALAAIAMAMEDSGGITVDPLMLTQDRLLETPCQGADAAP